MLTFFYACYAMGDLYWLLNERKRSPFRRLYLSFAFFFLNEYAMWFASCFWNGDTLWNPYFWFDGLLSVIAVWMALSYRRVVEESMKLLPVLFYLLVFEPPREEATHGILMTAVGFATFENVCYLTTNGASNFTWLLIRGAGSGAMHIVCGMLMGLGLLALWNVAWLKSAGTVAMLGFVVIYHAIYNLLVSQEGIAAVVGYLLPLLTVAAVLTFGRRLKGVIVPEK